jgi:hypothetical protein
MPPEVQSRVVSNPRRPTILVLREQIEVWVNEGGAGDDVQP